jgi:very-short-patch-repair endonuclease
LAEEQHGVLARQQLNMARGDLDRLVALGVLRRRQRALYELCDGRGGWRRDLTAALLAKEPTGVWSLETVAYRRTAAAVWELDGVEPGVVELAGPAHARSAGRARLVSLQPTDRVCHQGFPVTTVARTLLALGVVCSADLVERAMECALRRKLVTIGNLKQMLEVHAHVRGCSCLRVVLARRPPGAPPTESDAETRFVQLCRAAGLPDPVRQLRLRMSGREFRADFAWPPQCLLVEVDGAATHATPAALTRDLERQNLLMGVWHVRRFTWFDIVGRPDYVRTTLLGAVRW